MTRIDIRAEFGWNHAEIGDAELWFKGYVLGPGIEHEVRTLLSNGDPDQARVESWLRSLDGQFALVVSRLGWCLAAVDRTRSIPLFFAEAETGICVDSSAVRLVERQGLDRIDQRAALALAMGGYTIGEDTLYEGLKVITIGHFLLVDESNSKSSSYHQWQPWLIQPRPPAELKDELTSLSLRIIEKLIESAGDRTIAVPISAGFDSRFVLSTLAHLGHRNVVCFSYGQLGNYEAEVGRRVAETLGYEWRFARSTFKGQRRFLRSEHQAAFLRFADMCDTCPAHQELAVLMELRAGGFLKEDTIVVNGNTGDFITGLHIVSPLDEVQQDASCSQLETLVVDRFINKHFRLWQALATSDNDQVLGELIRRDVEALGLREHLRPKTAHSVYEFLEFQNRQSKYTIAAFQRAYEFAGFDWRLPLWDQDYLEFWGTVPLEQKAGQRLYREMLFENDWGRVWAIPGSWVSRPLVAPLAVRRFLWPIIRGALLPFPSDARQRFNDRYLKYWTDNVANHALVPYWKVAMDPRGPRHWVSWWTEAYLESKGVSVAGFLGPSTQTTF